MHCLFEETYFTMIRGDTFELPLEIKESDDSLATGIYKLKDDDIIYVAILEPNQSFENALIRKTITNKDKTDGRGNPVFVLEPLDTEYLLNGKYFIMIKLSYKEEMMTKIKTILPMREFFIEGTEKHVSDNHFTTYEISIDDGNSPIWMPIE